MNPFWRIKGHLMMYHMYSPEIETAEAIFLIYEAGRLQEQMSANRDVE